MSSMHKGLRANSANPNRRLRRRCEPMPQPKLQLNLILHDHSHHLDQRQTPVTPHRLRHRPGRLRQDNTRRFASEHLHQVRPRVDRRVFDRQLRRHIRRRLGRPGRH